MQQVGEWISHNNFNFTHSYVKLELKIFAPISTQKCFNVFVQSVVDARGTGDENPESSVVAEAMELLRNSFYGKQIIDRSRHTETKYLNYEKTRKNINGKLAQRLNIMSNEVALVKSKTEHREPIIAGLFILQ